MDTMQYEQYRGASPTSQYHYQNQYSYPQPLPPPNPAYYQQFTQPQSLYDNEHPPPIPPNHMNNDYAGQQPQYQNQPLPPLPQRHQDHTYNGQGLQNSQYLGPAYPANRPVSPYEQAPPLPMRNAERSYFTSPSGSYDGRVGPVGEISGYPTNNPSMSYVASPPPQRFENPFGTDDDISDPAHYTRDPQKLVAYLVPFPKPQISGTDPDKIPTRFLIYTPPPPPLKAPKEGEKEAKLHKVQRKWQEEVRTAKASNAKVASWKGVKSRATKAIAWGVNQTTTSNLEFLGRVSDGQGDSKDATGSDPNSPTTKSKPTPVSEMLLVYPPSIGLNDQQMREEFVNTMLRTKSKAQRDSIIATGLLPVGFGIDILATLIWPFGGLGEIDSVWLYSSMRGAKTAGSVTKRLGSSSSSTNQNEDTLQLKFTPSHRLDVLSRYLGAECHKVDPAKFPEFRMAPTETEVLEAIGWSSALVVDGEERDLEQEKIEMDDVKEDLRSNMHKGAKEWKKFCVAYAKDPEKAMKK